MRPYENNFVILVSKGKEQQRCPERESDGRCGPVSAGQWCSCLEGEGLLYILRVTAEREDRFLTFTAEVDRGDDDYLSRKLRLPLEVTCKCVCLSVFVCLSACPIQLHPDFLPNIS